MLYCFEVISLYSLQERIRTGGLSKSVYKIETGWNLPPVIQIVARTVQLRVDIS